MGKFADELEKRDNEGAPPARETGRFAAALAERESVDDAIDVNALSNTGEPVKQGVIAATRGAVRGLADLGEAASFGDRFMDSTSRSVAFNRGFNADPFQSKLSRIVSGAKASVFPTREDAMRAGRMQLPTRDEALDLARSAGLNVDPKPSEERTSQERFAITAGDVVGEGSTFLIPTTAGAAVLSRAGLKGSSILSRLGRGIGETFKRNPAAFVAAEAGALSGSAQLAGAADVAFPDNNTARLAGEVVGGFFNPTAVGIRATGEAVTGAKTAIKSVTKSGRQANAAAVLQGLALDMGEDPAELARALRAVDPDDLVLSAAQKTGSPALTKLEATIARDNFKFERANVERTKEAIQNIEGVINTLVAGGSTEQLRMAAQARKTLFESQISNRLKIAEREAMKTFSKFGNNNRVTASTETERVLRNALSEVEDVERSLWRKVPKNILMPLDDASPLRDAVEEASSRLLQEERLPFVDTLSEVLSSNATTSGELIKLRSALLSEGRKLRASKDYRAAGVASELADGVLRQLDTLGDPRLAEARQFSAAKHDMFTRTFAGNVNNVDRFGSDRIPPEVLLDRAFGSGGAAGSVRTRQLTDAAAFADEHTDGRFLFEDHVNTAQDSFMRAAIGELIGPDGVVNPNTLATFMRKHNETLNRFPELRADLQDAQVATDRLKQYQRLSKQAPRAVRQRAIFAQLTGFENPVDGVTRVMKSNEPERGIRELARMSKHAGTDAVAGLRKTVLKSLEEQSRDANGNIDFNTMQSILNRKMSDKGSSIGGLLVNSHVMKPEAMDNYKRLITRAAEIQNTANTKLRPEELLTPPDAITTLVTRVAGARLGSLLAEGGGSGSSLIAAGAGSQALRTQLDKIPSGKTMDVLVEAAENPALMAKLLQKPISPRRGFKLGTQINTFLIQAGVLPEEEEEPQQ